MAGLFLFMPLGLRLDWNGHFQILQIGIMRHDLFDVVNAHESDPAANRVRML